MSDCKPCQLVECVPANDFSYSLAVPPAPPPPPGPPFGNDSFQYCCPDSEPMTFTGTLPNWLTLSGNCLVVIPNTFRAFDKAVANGEAQAALDSFVATNQNNISCAGSTVTVCNEEQCAYVVCP